MDTLRKGLSRWLLLQILLGIPLVVAPVFLKGIISLVVTVPLYIIIVVLVQKREALQQRHSEKAVLVARLKAVTSHLAKLTQGAHGPSVWAIVRDLLHNQDFQHQLEVTGNRQAGTLLHGHCERLFDDVRAFHNHVDNLTRGCPDKELEDVVLTLQRLFIEYRKLVDEFLEFLRETKAERKCVQDKAHFSTRVHDELADDYDRLMDDVRQLRTELLNVAGIEFLKDDQLSHFLRATILRE